ncbi:MAG: hypothetical protein E7341_02640 [Clostridiales bacterium]|nr:hypothetical protein [Clostridiales bacterium]
MSFFNAIFKELDISEDKNNIMISTIIGKGAMLVCDYKILSFEDYEIVVLVNKISLKIYGEKLKIKTMSKGELVVSGNVVGVVKI